jgi:hypothetical protein
MRLATRARTRVSVIAACLLALASSGSTDAANGGWTITATPSSVIQGAATNVLMTATNISGGSSIGCVRLTLPSAFAVSSVAIATTPPGLDWTAGAPTPGGGGSTVVQVHALTEAEILKNDGLVVTFTVRVTGTVVGSHTWAAESRDHYDCTSGIDTTTVSVSIIGAPTPTSTPSPGPTPNPTPSPAPTPSPMATPPPTPRPSPPPATPAPPPSATAAPVATPVPSPSAGSSSRPGESQSVRPVPSSSGLAAIPSGGPSPSVAGLESSDAPSRPEPTRASNGAGRAPDAVDGDGPFSVGGTDASARRIDARLVESSLMRLDGLLVWAVPSLVLTGPGLLLLLAILAQIAGGAVWLPVVRRKLGAFGIRRRR